MFTLPNTQPLYACQGINEYQAEAQCDAGQYPLKYQKVCCSKSTETYAWKAVLRSWRGTGKCRHGSHEMYARRHWYEVVTVSDWIMKLYFDRQPRGGRGGARWWLFSIREPEKSSVSS